MNSSRYFSIILGEVHISLHINHIIENTEKVLQLVTSDDNHATHCSIVSKIVFHVKLC